MSKPFRGQAIRELPAHGRGTCARCKKEGVKILYDQEINGAKAKICKICKASIKNGKTV
ncbi:MAG TPA: hypothetical protein PLU33_01365 [Treponemataceae bacterium]|jgi:hypothetical protein|nr:hypothetical protein [Spirochaetaceae bacterium]HOE07502.1 hypothetical protein [Treponemataceae bacterium]HOS29214.1 hypothetical protein [Treponemataceae bacterium]HPX25614.1 hypothetical protein [Treponemataceae bacterium]HQL03758.1 hypothetical protein [Treponemataceae bacterium]